MKTGTIFLFAAAALFAPAASAAKQEHLDVPKLDDVFRRSAAAEAREERETPFGWNDGENLLFERQGWKFAFNNREITQIAVPDGADVHQFAEFLLKEPWEKRLVPRLREGAELTPGERQVVRIVYTAWIDSLKSLASVGYQHLVFHACVNAKAFPHRVKDVVYGDGTIYAGLRQNFFDRVPGRWEPTFSVPEWGASFDDPRDERRKLLKRIIHAGNEKPASAMKQPQLNDYFYVSPHVVAWEQEMKAADGSGISRIELWRRVSDEVLAEIAVLASIKAEIGNWRDSFRPVSLSEKDASNLDAEMTDLARRLDAANEEAVRRARIVFYDYPLSRACFAFKVDIEDSTSMWNKEATNRENLKNAGNKFRGDIAGESMLANIKAAYSANEYARTIEAFKKAAGEKNAFGLLQETGIRELGIDVMGKIAEGRDPWAPNDLPDLYANLGEFRHEILADATNSVARADTAKAAAAEAVHAAGAPRAAADRADAQAAAALSEANDTLESRLDIPDAKEKAAAAKKKSVEAAAAVQKARMCIGRIEDGNRTVKALADEIETKRREATGNLSQAPDYARQMASDAVSAVEKAEKTVEEGKNDIEEAKKQAAAAGEAAAEAKKLSSEAAKIRKAEEKRVADEKIAAARSAMDEAGEADAKAKTAADDILAARQTAERAIADCGPTEKSHLEIDEIQAMAREAKAAAEDALKAVGFSQAAVDRTVELVATSRRDGNEALQQAGLVYTNQSAVIVREALEAAIGKTASSAESAAGATARAADARSWADKAREKAAEAKEKADRSAADRRDEEKRVANDKRALADAAAAKNDESGEKIVAAGKRAAAARERASAAKRDCIPTHKTHLDIPETRQLASEADGLGDDAIAAAGAAEKAASESDGSIRKSKAKIAVALEQAAIALDETRSTDAIRDALDRAIAAATDADGFAREGAASAAKAEESSLAAESKAEAAADRAGRAAEQRKTAEKALAEEKKRTVEEAVELDRKAKQEADAARETLLAARETAVAARTRCEPTKDSRLDIPDIKARASEAVQTGGEALSAAKTAERHVADASKTIDAAERNAASAAVQCGIASDESRTPDEVRAALDKAVLYADEAKRLSEEAKSISAKASEAASEAKRKAEDAERTADQSTKDRRAAEVEMANAKKAEAEAAAEAAAAAISKANDALDRANRARDDAADRLSAITDSLKNGELSDDERKAAKEARRAAEAAVDAAKDAVSAATKTKSTAEDARNIADEAVMLAKTALDNGQTPDAVRDALDKAIRTARKAAERAADAGKRADETDRIAEKAETNAAAAR